ncbi:conjugal transfer protein TraL, partial [Neisseria iguanae]
NRNPDTFGADIKKMTSANLTLSEAQSSELFGLMPRQRLRTVQKDLFARLDQVPFIATAHHEQTGE